MYNRHASKLTALPARLDGLEVVDIGGYDGAIARACLARGAAKATVVDSQQYRDYQDYPDPPPSDDERLHFVVGDASDWRRQADFLVCFDVLYHVDDPLGFMRHLRSVAGGQMAFSTRICAGQGAVFKLVAPNEEHPDPTVRWKPTFEGLNKLAEISGFSVVRWTFHERPGTIEPDGLAVGLLE